MPETPQICPRENAPAQLLPRALLCILFFALLCLACTSCAGLWRLRKQQRAHTTRTIEERCSRHARALTALPAAVHCNLETLLTRRRNDMDESLTGKSMDESLTGRPPFKPLGLPHRITPGNSATNLHGTDELDDSDRDGRVLVLLTGGTMGMKPNARGSLEPKAGYLAEQMRLMPELRERRMPAYEVVEYAPLLDSADMVPQDWRRIAQDIAQSHNQFDGFVVIMGTDTMAYCASALSFMLEGLSKPVVLTGSMIPFAERLSADARRNLRDGFDLRARGTQRGRRVFWGSITPGQPHDEGRRARFVGVRLAELSSARVVWRRTKSKVRPGVGAVVGAKM